MVTNIVISDPETGEVWEWSIPKSDVSVNSSTNSSSKMLSLMSNPLDEDEVEEIITTEVSIDIGKYLDMTLEPLAVQSTIDKSTSITDDITIITGLTYSKNASNNTISVYNVFGSTTPKGSYYASDRVVYWRNPGADVGGTFYPTSNSWNYSTDSTAGTYYSSLPPYSILDCRVRITGMSAYRDISVTCTLP